MVGSEGQAWMTCLGLARRRLSRNEVLRRLALGISAAAVLLLLLLMARGIGVDLGGIIWSSTGVPVVIGAAFATRTAVSLTDAAIYIDRRSGGGDLFSSALASGEGLFAGPIQGEAERRCPKVNVPRLTRYSASLPARATPVILALCLSIGIATPASGASVSPGEPGGTAPIGIMEARVLIADLEAGAGGGPDLAARLEETYRGLDEWRATYQEVLANLRVDPHLRKAIDEGRIGTADLAAKDVESILTRLQAAADRLPDGERARMAADSARAALQAGADDSMIASLAALADALHEGAGPAVEEMMAEIRRIGSQRAIPLSRPTAETAAPDLGKAWSIPIGGEGLERAMDREDVPRRYRDTVRRYFERKGGEGR